MKRSPMPPRTVPMPRASRLQVAGKDGVPELASVTAIGSGGRVLPLRKAARDTIPARVRRIVAERDMGLCVYTGKPAGHIHHRRLKGMGGASSAHTDCPCNLVSLTLEAHEFAHRNRPVALAEGLIVPANTAHPGILPVLVHGLEDGSGLRVWPTCDGRWTDFEPDGGSAA